jgi:hypothetical protein
MTRDIKKYVATYDICQRIHVPRHRPYGELHPLSIPERPNQDLSIDFITDLLSYKKRENIQVHDNVLIIINRYSKLAKYIITRKDLTAESLVTLIIQHVVNQTEPPRFIISNKRPQFSNDY